MIPLWAGALLRLMLIMIAHMEFQFNKSAGKPALQSVK